MDNVHRTEKINCADQFLHWHELSEPEKINLKQKSATIPELLNKQEKRDWFQQFPDICLSSDAYFPFRDSIDRAHNSNVRCLAQPLGSLRDQDVITAADSYNMIMCDKGLRLFTH